MGHRVWTFRTNNNYLVTNTALSTGGLYSAAIHRGRCQDVNVRSYKLFEEICCGRFQSRVPPKRLLHIFQNTRPDNPTNRQYNPEL